MEGHTLRAREGEGEAGAQGAIQIPASFQFADPILVGIKQYFIHPLPALPRPCPIPLPVLMRESRVPLPIVALPDEEAGAPIREPVAEALPLPYLDPAALLPPRAGFLSAVALLASAAAASLSLAAALSRSSSFFLSAS